MRNLLIRVLLFMLLGVLATTEVVTAAAPHRLQATPYMRVDAAQAAQQAAADEPLDCIDPLKTANIAATIASLAPIPLFKQAAELTAFATNLALKDCPPDLNPPADVVVQTPSEVCSHRLRVPIPRNYDGLIFLDREVITEVMQDPELALKPNEIEALREELRSVWGRFEDVTYGSYVNIYGFEVPLTLSEFAGNNWGDLGTPDIYHFNSDVLITLDFPGTRVSIDDVELPVGSHTAFWEGDTLITLFDQIPIITLTGAGTFAKKAYKEGLTKAFKQSLKEAIDQIRKQGAKETAKIFAKEVAKSAAKKLALKGYTVVTAVRKPYFVSGEPRGHISRNQRIYVIDAVPPEITNIQDVTVEALEPGGVSSSQHVGRILEGLSITDNCVENPIVRSSTPAFWPLTLDENGNPLTAAQIVWTAEDHGAAGPTGGVNSTTATQNIIVQDTKPPIIVAPPPVIKESDGSVPIDLGQPQVFDVADLRPTIDHNVRNLDVQAAGVTLTLTPGLYAVDWTATDASGNSDSAIQIVNVKTPGTNNLPAAIAQAGEQAIQAIADVPVSITLRAEDPDGDPLWFSITESPRNGFFIAPLYPYFIADYRLQARYSPQIAAKAGDPDAGFIDADIMKQRCIDSEHVDGEQTSGRVEMEGDFVNFYGGSSKYIAVDDDGYTYVFDSRYICNKSTSTTMLDGQPRIARFDRDGVFVDSFDLGGNSSFKDVHFDLIHKRIILANSDSSSTGYGYFGIFDINPPQPGGREALTPVFAYTLPNEIEKLPNGEWPQYLNVDGAVIDANDIIYLMSRQRLRGLLAYRPSPKDPEKLQYVGALVRGQNRYWDDEDESGVEMQDIYDIALDKDGNVYASGTTRLPHNGGFIDHDRVYKFNAATIDANGDVILGEPVGWMGKCVDGDDCDYIAQRSIGYRCTDATCVVVDPDDPDDRGFGDRPGQFNEPSAIAIDSNNVLYVADVNNQRVQRFNPEGLWAGEANSTGGGDSFVLGDFGRPNYITVNRSNLYILDYDLEILHVFEASAVTPIDHNSSRVVYQSNSNYRGMDEFFFAATDGLRDGDDNMIMSPTGRVEIQVERNFRPPNAFDNLFAVTDEDTPVDLLLEASDLDEDPHVFNILHQPTNGSLSGDPPAMTYTPDPDFFGVDSFVFRVVDNSSGEDSALFEVFVEPMDDAPRVEPEQNEYAGGAGFPVTIMALVNDPDITEITTGTLSVTVNWGDGTQQSDGQIAEDSSLTGPVLTPNPDGTYSLLAYHTYNSQGAYTVDISVTDGTGLTGEASLTVQVTPMSDLSLERTTPRAVAVDQSGVSYRLEVTNRAPSAGGGITANDVTVTEVLTGGLSYAGAVSENGTCTAAGMELSCSVGNLAVGETAVVIVQANLPGGARAGDLYELDADGTAQQADPIPENNRNLHNTTVVAIADFIVDDDGDTGDNTPGDGACATDKETCTLRAAIQEANALSGKQVIALGDAIHQINLPEDTAAFLRAAITGAGPVADDDATSGDLDITDDLDLIGISAGRSLVNGNELDRVFDVLNGAIVTIEAIGIVGGSPIDQAAGGGLRNVDGTVILRRAGVAGNIAGQGGGIANEGGSLSIYNSSITNNQTVEGGSGGGISNRSTLLLENVTLSNNRAGAGGGLLALGGEATLRHVTVTENWAANAGGGVNGDSNATRIYNTILADNSAGIGANCAPSIRSDGNNLIGNTSDCQISDGSNDIVGVGALLQSLQLNENDTYAHPPSPESQALDRGVCDVEIDQGGQSRPQGESCDIGADELTFNPAVADESATYLPAISR